MSPKEFNRIWEEVARRHGTTIEDVTCSIDIAINETLENIRESGDFGKMLLWNSIPPERNVPSAEELVLYLADKKLTGI